MHNRIILAVREHIVPEETGAGGGVAVRVQEALDDGVVVSALQVIEAGLYLPEVAQRSKNRSDSAAKSSFKHPYMRLRKKI